MRNCSCVTGKYQQTSDQGERASSTTFLVRASVTKVNRGAVVQEPAEDHRAVRRTAVAAHRRHLDESRVRCVPVLM